jgi:hypothetical protein
MEYVIVIFNVNNLRESVDRVVGPFEFEDSCDDWMQANEPTRIYEVVKLSPHGLDA